MNDENDEIFGRITESGDVALLYVADGTAVTRLAIDGIYPVGSTLSTRYEHPNGIVISTSDAERIGVIVDSAPV